MSQPTSPTRRRAIPTVLPTELPLDEITIPDDRIRQDLGDIAKLAEDITENGLINDITVCWNGSGWVLDTGARRLAAFKLLGRVTIPVRVKKGRGRGREISENVSRDGFTLSERKAAAEILLRQDPGLNDLQVATKSGASNKTVAKIRARLVADGVIPAITTSIDTQGRKQPSKKAASVLRDVGNSQRLQEKDQVDGQIGSDEIDPTLANQPEESSPDDLPDDEDSGEDEITETDQGEDELEPETFAEAIAEGVAAFERALVLYPKYIDGEEADAVIAALNVCGKVERGFEGWRSKPPRPRAAS